MDPDNSRRSACDRCRGQKLRCVRSPKQSSAADGQTLQSCERCIKAGARCFSTLPPPRKLTRTERLPTPPNPTLMSSQKAPLHQPGFGADVPLVTGGASGAGGAGSIAASRLSSTSGSSSVHRRGSSHTPILGLDRKRRFGNLDTEQPEPPKFNAHDHVTIERQRRGLGDIHSPATGPMDVSAFSRSPVSEHIGMGTFDFEMGLVSQPGTAPPDEGTTWMDMLLCQGKGSLPTSKVSNIIEKGADQVIESKEEFLYRLSELNSQLLKDFGRMSSMKFSDLLSSSFYYDADNLQGLHNSERAMHQNNAIGGVLNNSQTFLDTLQYLVPGIPEGAESECSYSEDGDDLSCSRRMAVGPGSPSHPTLGSARTSLNGSPKAPSSTADVPTMLTVFTCYAWLLQTYDRIFSLLHTALISETRLSLQSLPKVLPGLHVGGFSLDDQQYLQVEMLIHLSTQMLERIEEALRTNVTSQVRDNRENTLHDQEVLDATLFSAFLDTILEQKPLKRMGGVQKKGAEGVKQTMERIRRILRSIS
ncbi:hypothetical protein F4814DRAFT_424784 [Daldinia grandis]|nr:hypothetical protein F4814DRAFT_424784 [Daldinia grandis]